MVYEAQQPTETTSPEALDAEQVGRLLGCSAAHVRRLAARGLFPAPIELGALRRWSRAAVLEWLATRGGMTATRAGLEVQVRG
jgi:predicted DNA-binding transcriptional regulator AlpA